MDELFATYKMVEPDKTYDYIEKESPLNKYEDKLSKFLRVTKEYFKVKDTSDNSTLTQNDDQDWFRNKAVLNTQNTDLPVDNNSKYLSMSLDDVLKSTGLDLYIKITSGYRDHNVGKAGNRSNHRKKNPQGLPMAYDIVPINESYDLMYARMAENQELQNWLKANGFNINDETSKETLAKTGGTGAHFHIGPDSFNVRTGKFGFDTKELLELFSEYSPVESNIPDEVRRMADEIDITPKYLDRIWGKKDESKQSDDLDWFGNKAIQDQLAQPQIEEQRTTIPENVLTNSSFNSDFQKYGTSDTFLNHRDWWTKLALAESSLNPNAHNKQSGAYGYFLLMKQNRTGDDVASLFRDAESLYNSFDKQITETDLKLAKEKGITRDGILAGMWLGGPAGAKRALRSQSNAADANGTSVMSYMKKFSS